MLATVSRLKVRSQRYLCGRDANRLRKKLLLLCMPSCIVFQLSLGHCTYLTYFTAWYELYFIWITADVLGGHYGRLHGIPGVCWVR